MAKKTPIALLCGYLGAGKTTLLNSVLNNQKGYRVAVIVNDIGEVNVDASLIAHGASLTDTSDIVPLTNGCICCTLKSQMAKNIEKLIRTGKYDYILIEASGVCEPMPIAQELELVKNGFLDNVVGVVDAMRLVDEFASGEKLLDKERIGEEDIESLLIQQIEFCSTLVISKIDLVTEEQLATVRKAIDVLHPDAKVILSDHGNVPVEDILGTGSFDFDEVFSAAGWCRTLDEGELGDDTDDEMHHREGEEHHHEHRKEGESEDEYGIGTYIYCRRVPFSRAKLKAFVHSWPKNVIRCKGLVWFSDDNDLAYVLETAGRQFSCGPYGRWVASAPAEERVRILAESPETANDWDDEVGDRMTRLCFIGQNLDRKEIASLFDALLDD